MELERRHPVISRPAAGAALTSLLLAITWGSSLLADGAGTELRSASASAYTPGAEVLWLTSGSTQEVGFHIFREAPNGEREQISHRLIAGSSVVYSHGPGPFSDRSYSWCDPLGRPGDRYWIESHAIDGNTHLFGPLIATAAPPGQRPSIASPTLSSAPRTSQRSAPPRPRVAEASLPIDPEVGSWLAARTALKIAIDREGWYRISHRDWWMAGLPETVDASLLQLYRRGVEHAITVSGGEDGEFGPGDGVEFYGLGIDTPTTDRAVYWLTVGQRPGLRIPKESPPLTTPLSPASFPHTVVEATETQHFAALRNGETDNFFGEVISGTTVTRFLSLPHFDATSPDPVTLEVSLQGLGNQDHDVTIVVNGVRLGQCLSTGAEHATARFPIPPLLVQPTLEIELTSSGDEDLALLDTISVTYPREFAAGKTFLRGSAPGGAPLLLQQALPGTRVFDVTDPTRVIELVGNTISIPGGETVAMTVHLPPGDERIWASVPPWTMTPVASLSANSRSRLAREEVGASFVIVTPERWREVLEPLASWRRLEGISTRIVGAEDLFDEWNGGEVSPCAIREFLRDATARWQNPPRYLLLVGDTSADPRQRLPDAAASLLPTQWIETAQVETASDQWFGDLDLDGRAEVAVGRLPFFTRGEVDRYVRRAVAQGAHLPKDVIPGLTLVISDENGFPGVEIARATFDEGDASPAARCRLSDAHAQTLLEDSLRAGTDLIAYFGAGGTDDWDSGNLLTAARVCALGYEDAHPIVIALGSLNGSFHHRHSASLAEAWIASGQGGALAVWASTAVEEPQQRRELGRALLEDLQRGPAVRLGDVFLRAQDAFDPEVLRTTVLIGDPTVRYQR